MDIARITDHLPVNRALIGIQPEIMDWGMEPTASVQNALGTAASEAVTLIRQWQELNSDQESSVTKQ